MKFGKGMADKGGRAMKNRTPDKMGRAMVKKMAAGGPSGTTPLPRDEDLVPPPLRLMPRGMQAARENQGMKRGPRMAGGGMTYKKGGKVKSGSSASKRADGIAHKGKTKGKMVKMAYGGKC
jgi:hypothetical protein